MKEIQKDENTQDSNNLSFSDYISIFTKGNIEKIRKCITKENVNDKISCDYTPILLAARLGNTEVLDYLVSQGADLKSTDSKGHGIFYYADMKNNPTKTRKNNTDCYFPYENENSNYFFATIIINECLTNNDLNHYKEDLFEKLKNIPFTYSLNYLLSTEENRKKCLEYQEKKAVKFLKARTLLLKKIFCELGISLESETKLVNILKRSGITDFCYIPNLLSTASFFGNSELLSYLIECKKQSIKHELAPKNLDESTFLEESKKMLEDYINKKAFDGWNALHHACSFRYKNILTTLLKNGAKANILASDNIDALYRCVCEENIEMLEMLFDYNVIEHFNDAEIKALFCNIISKQFFGHKGNNPKIKPSIIRILHDRGLFSTKIKNNMTFYHFSARENLDYKVLNDFFIDSKDLKKEDMFCFNPLNYAIICGNMEPVNFFMSKMDSLTTSYINSYALNKSLKLCKDPAVKKKVLNKIFDEIYAGLNKFDNKSIVNFFSLNNSVFYDSLLDKKTYSYYHDKFMKKYDIDLDLLYDAFNKVSPIILGSKNLSNDLINQIKKELKKIVLNNLNKHQTNNLKTLLDSIDNQDINKLKSLMNTNPILLNYEINDQSLLWYATENLKEDVALYLSDFDNFDINETDKKNDGDTLLMLACDNNLNKLSEKLIRKNADLTLSNKKGFDIFQKACKIDNDIILKSLEKDLEQVIQKKYGNTEQTLLLCAAFYSSNKALNFLINKGFNVNQTDNLGKTPIMHAYDFENFEAITLLLNANANPHKEYIKENDLKKVEEWLKNQNSKLVKKSSKLNLLSNKLYQENFPQNKCKHKSK